MKYKVRILAKAQSDVEACHQYLAKRSPQGAAAWFDSFAAGRDELARRADTLALAPEAEAAGYDVRQLLFKTRRGRPYRILFLIVGDEVRILRVRGPGQDFVPSDELAAEPLEE